MKRTLLTIGILVALALFLFAGVAIAVTVFREQKIKTDLDYAVQQYTATHRPVQDDVTAQVTKQPTQQSGESTDSLAEEQSTAPENTSNPILAPIEVDFDALRQVNDEIVGWIYCEDTPINFAVCQATDDTYYLSHSYERKESRAGAIFVEATNRPGFADANTIVYGHHTTNDTMFSCLDQWGEQAFFDAHSNWYLLTPDGDFRIDLFAAYTTSAFSDSYSVYYNHTSASRDYLETVLSRSVVDANREVDPEANCIMFSTCAYDYHKARFVIHGMLVPIDSAGGKPLNRDHKKFAA